MKHFLIVVDMQKDFVDGALGSPEAQAIVPRVMDKILRFEGKTFATLDTHAANYLETAEGKKLPVPHCIEDTEGYELYGKVRGCVESGDIVIKKPSFGSLELAEILREKNFDEVELCGLVTDICVVSNALMLKSKLYDKGEKVSVIEDLCAGTSVDNHNAAIQVMKSCQIEIK